MATILVIDDEEGVRKILCEALRFSGHTVVEARNGQEGLRLWRAQPFDLILCDIVMPEKDGLETICELRREDASAKIIAMSGGLQDFDPLPIASIFGAVAVLRKPFNLTELLRVVAAAV